MNQAALELLIKLKDQATAPIQSIGASLSGLGVAAIAGAGIAGVAMLKFGADAVKAAGDFEAGMNRLNAVAGGALKEAGLSLDQFRDKALQLGKETQFSAAEAQEAMINLAKGGVPIKNILSDATSAVLDLASAGEVNLASSADIVAKQLGIWGEKGVKAADVTNLLAQAANASTVDVEELALGLAQAGGGAKASGVSFQDLVQTMALLAPGFSSAADAGTSLKTLITRLIPQTDDAAGMMKKLGLRTFDAAKAADFLNARGFNLNPKNIDAVRAAMDKFADQTKMSKKAYAAFVSGFEKSVFYDAQGQFLGMENAAQKLSEAFAGLSDEQKNQALHTIFGADALRAAAALANAGAKGFKAMGASMGAAGTAAEQAKLKQVGLNFALETLKGTMDTIAIVVGGFLLPIITSLINNVLIPGANAVLDFFSALSKGDGVVRMITDALRSLLGEDIASFFGGLLSNADGMAASIGQAMSSIPAAWQMAKEKLSPVVASIAATVRGVFAKLKEFLDRHGDEIRTTFLAAWNKVKTIIGTNGEIILTMWGGIASKIEAFVTRHGATISAALDGSWTLIRMSLKVTLDLIHGILKTALQLMQGDTDGAMTTIRETIGSAWTTIKHSFARIVGDINTVAKDLFGVDIVATVTRLSDGVGNAWGTAKGRVVSILETMREKVSSVFQNASTSLVEHGVDVSAIPTVWENLKTRVSSVIGWISTGISAAFQNVKTSLVEHGVDVSAIPTVWENLKTRLSPVIAAIQAIVTTVFGEIRKFLGTHGSDIEQAFGGTWEKIKGIATDAATIVAYVIGGMALSVSDNSFDMQKALGGAWDTIKGTIELALGVIGGVLKTALQLMQGDTDGAMTTLKQTFWSAWESIKLTAGGAATTINEIAKGLFGVDVVASVSGIATKASETFAQIKTDAAPALAFVGRVFDEMVDQNKKKLNELASAWETLKVVLTPIVEGVKTSIATAFADANTFLANHQTEVDNFLLGWEEAKSAVAVKVEAVRTSFLAAFAKIGEYLATHKIDTTNVQTTWETTSALLMPIISGIQSGIETAFAAISTKVTSEVETIKEVIETAFTAISTKVTSEIKTIKETIEKAWASIKKTFTDTLELIRQELEKAWKAINDAATNAVGALKETFTNAISDILNAGKESVQDFMNFGESLVKAIADGIRNSPTAVWNALKDIIMKQLTDLANFLGLDVGSIFRSNPSASGKQFSESNLSKGVAKAAVSQKALDVSRQENAPIQIQPVRGATTINITINASLNSEMDIDDLAAQIARRVRFAL